MIAKCSSGASRLVTPSGSTKVGTPKTETSAKPVPVIEPLRTILAELREADGNPQSGYILRGERKSNKTGTVPPLNLDNVARREIIPTLRKKKIAWHGYYAFRRGIGTRATAETKDALAAKGLLRHNNMATTTAHYVKDVPETTRNAMQIIEQRTLTLMAKRAAKKDITEGPDQQPADELCGKSVANQASRQETHAQAQ